MAGKKLTRHVTVAGVTYGPNDDVPAEVAAQIKNPKAWAPVDGTDDDPDAAARKAKAGTTGGKKLATAVTVGGRTYLPEDHIPDDVAAQIKNPKAWEGGKVPSAKSTTDKVTDDAKEAGAKAATEVKSAAKAAAPAKAAPSKATFTAAKPAE